MRAVALVESLDHVCVRYRLAAFQAALAQAGHTLAITPFAKTMFARLQQYKAMEQFDAVILQRSLLPTFELGWLRKRAKHLIFDFDDAIWRRDSYSAKLQSAKRLKRFRNTVRVADRVIAGNAFLAEHAPGSVVIPTCVPVPLATLPKRERTQSALTLVWIGSSSTLQSLEVMRPTLAAIGTAFPSSTLKIICDRTVDFTPLTTRFVRWSATTESREIAASHVGIAVMPDDDWSRGKCGVKVLQYLAAGLPVIANRVGVHVEMIPGAGVLADTTEEWIAAVRRLHDARLRSHFGQAGRERVRDEYSIDAGAAAWTRLLDTLERKVAC